MKKKTVIIISCLAILTLVLAFIIFYIKMNRPSTVLLYIDPQTISGTVGQDFAVNIRISHVADLYGWEFKLSWNPILLDAVNVTEGPFLKQGGDTFFFNKINNTEGYLLVDCTRLGEVSGASGDGIIATINLHVKGEGECLLDLHDTILLSSLEQPIDHEATDGYFGP